MARPRRPLIYEINTWVWLGEMGARLGRPVTLGTVPDGEWAALAALGFDAVWLMGVWERSPAGIRIAMANARLLADFRRALPDFRAEDNVGSPFCVRRYVVDGRLGEPEGLAAARRQLARRGIRLILDYVPNHVAPDHPWAFEHPEYFIRGTEEDLQKNPAAFLRVADQIIACSPRIPTSRPGPTSSSSMRSSRGCARRRWKPLRRSPLSATACVATWPCSR